MIASWTWCLVSEYCSFLLAQLPLFPSDVACFVSLYLFVVDSFPCSFPSLLSLSHTIPSLFKRLPGLLGLHKFFLGLLLDVTETWDADLYNGLPEIWGILLYFDMHLL
jgi:hypothetical protein